MVAEFIDFWIIAFSKAQFLKMDVVLRESLHADNSYTLKAEFLCSSQFAQVNYIVCE